MNLKTFNYPSLSYYIGKMKHANISEDNPDGVLMRWIPYHYHNKNYIVEQYALLKSVTENNIKTVIFDDSLTMKPEDIEHLCKYKNIVLCEPVINNRKCFEYLPFFIQYHNTVDYEKKFDLYVNLNQNSSKIMEKYIYPLQRDFGRSICIDKDNNEDGLNEQLVRQARYAFISANKFSIMSGYIPNINEILKYTSIIVPEEHRYFHSLGVLVGNVSDLDYYTRPDLYSAWIEDAYDRIETFYPEMLVDNVVQKILDFLS
jgi:hypothetical protein